VVLRWSIDSDAASVFTSNFRFPAVRAGEHLSLFEQSLTIFKRY